MVAKRKTTRENLATIIISLCLIIFTIINFSMAYFTDSSSATTNGAEFEFGTIYIDTSLNGETADGIGQYSVSADEVAMKNTLYKMIVLENGDVVTEPFYMRIKLSFYNNSAVSDLVTIAIAGSSDITSSKYGANYTSATNFNSSNWVLGNDEKLYYTTKLSIAGNEKKYIPLKIDFDEDFGQENFDSPYIQIDIEIIQSANNGYEGWGSDIPANWPVE